MTILVNGMEQTNVDVQDRGFQYGDGLFETIAYKNNQLEYWHEHLSRLQMGCKRLNIECVAESIWLGDIKKLALCNDAVIKLSLTRGVSSRGYAYADDGHVTRVTAVSDMPTYPEKHQQGITTTLCKTPISMNSALAGIKHLNCLDNVLARNEWQGSEIVEGFMFDCNDHIIEGTMSNVFCILGDELYTPSLETSGVAGIMRQHVINIAKQLNIPLNIVNISKQNFLQMDAVFVTNSLIGLWPVKKILLKESSVNFNNNSLVENIKNKLFNQ